MQEGRRFLHSVLTDLRLCQNLSTLEQLKNIAHLMADEGFYPSPAKGGEEVYKAFDINTLVEERCREVDPNIKGLAGLIKTMGFPLVVSGYQPSDGWCSCEWTVFKKERVTLGIVGGMWGYAKEQSNCQEPFALRLLDLVKKLYPIVHPRFVSLIDPDSDGHPMSDAQLSKFRITTLGWVNMFNADFVNHYGKDVFMNIPGYNVQELTDGGIFYQSRPSIVIQNDASHKYWQRATTAYFAKFGQRLHFNRLR